MGIKRKIMTMAGVGPLLSIIRSQLRVDRMPCLMYHEVLPDSVDIGVWTVVRESDFDAQLRHLRQHYTPIAIEEALDEYRVRHRWPNGAVLLTFDDGYSGNLATALPIAEAHGVPITVFVATRWVEEGRRHWFDRLILHFLSAKQTKIDLKEFGGAEIIITRPSDTESWWNDVSKVLEQLKRLPEENRNTFVDCLCQQNKDQSGLDFIAPLTVDGLKSLASSPCVSIGAHSHGHEILPRLSADEARQSVARSKMLLEQWLGCEVKHFAYPNGDYDQVTREIIRELAFATALTTKPGLWKPDDDLLALPRIGIGRFDPAGFFRSRVAGLVI